MTTTRRLLAALSVLGLALSSARAENKDLQLIKGGATPAAIHGMPSTQRLSCPLLVKPTEAALQPLSIDPAQVDAKNRLGCLSNNDAIYGADGCPQKLCGASRGVIPLNADAPNLEAPKLVLSLIHI